MSIFSSSALVTRAAIRGAAYIARDLCPWLIQAAASWLLSRLRGRSGIADCRCPNCPLRLIPEDPAIAPASATSLPSKDKTSNVAALCFLVGLGSFGCLTGGCAPSSAYVAADRATFNAIAPEYSEYVSADPAMDELRKARRRRTIDSWRMRLEQAEQSSPQ